MHTELGLKQFGIMNNFVGGRGDNTNICSLKWIDLSILYCLLGATATRSPHFGPGAGFIVLDNVNCNGNEVNLVQCQHNGFGVHNCVPAKDAGVFCSAGKSVLWILSRDTQNCIN